MQIKIFNIPKAFETDGICHKKLRVSRISEVEKPEFPSILESIIQAFQLRMIDFKILLQELKKQISIRNKI